MTKREICERLISIHNRLFHEYAMADGMEDIDIESIGKDIGSLILDLAAPEEHFADAGKMVREEVPPGVIAELGKDGEIERCWCQKCYGAADVVHDPFGDGNDWSYCKKCGVSFRLKLRGEEGK